MEPRARARGTAVALTAVLALGAVRFHAFLAGGTLYTRDAGFFFGPWRSLYPVLSADGVPFWNDFLSNGRAYAADPNAAVFWPLTPLAVLLSPTALALLNVAVLLVLFVWSLRLLGLGTAASLSGGAVLLFSGVFQTVPVLFGMTAAAAPLPLAVAAAAAIGGARGALRRRGTALLAAALALSALGGEPVVTAMGAAAAAAVAGGGAVVCARRDGAREAVRPLLAFAGGALLAAGLAALQILPAAGELARSARGTALAPEHGALFWSVRPARVLTLLEPRLTGDPAADEASLNWGAGTFDAGNPYFTDLALGLVPLALAAASAADPRGAAALLLALGGAVLSFGRFLPGFAEAARLLSFFRYPEKWWLLSTFALAAAAAVGVERLVSDDEGARRRAFGALRTGLLTTGLALLGLGLLAVASPSVLRSLLWSLSLGAGETPAANVAALLLPLLVGGAAAALAAGGLAELVRRGRAPRGALFAALALVFAADAARRVSGTLPAGPADLFARRTPAVSAVAAEMAHGRFYDDGADDRPTAERRTLEAGGTDLLRPATGVFFGIRYALENDIDRMTPARSVAAVFEAARLPWGEAKIARLREAGVAVARTAAPGPDPPGVTEVRRDGADRIVRIEATRPEFLFLPAPVLVRDEEEAAHARTMLRDPLRTGVIEMPDTPPGPRSSGSGTVRVLSRSPRALSLEVSATAPGAALLLGRTFHPGWKAVMDGAPVPIFPADGFLSALFVQEGTHRLELRFESALFRVGALFSALSAAAFLLLVLKGART